MCKRNISISNATALVDFYQEERRKLRRVDLKRIFLSKIANEKYVYVREKREAEMILYRA